MERQALKFEGSEKWVRGYARGELVFDSRHPVLFWEVPYYPAYYIPESDVIAGLIPNGESKRSPSRGDGEVLDVKVGGDVIEGAALRYPDSPIEELRDLIRFEWAALDEWLEEDEPVYTHPRDPYKRVDILHSSRHVRVEVDGATIAETHKPTILFETSLPPRYYIPLGEVKRELLRPSDSETHCPYKGTAGYFSVEVRGELHEDLGWIYRTPLPESQKVAGLVSFYNERVDLYVDGELQARPKTVFSK